MIEWRTEGILLAVRRHGESSAIIDVLTPDHGLVSGVVRGGASRKMAPILQMGAQLDVVWRARLEEHLGSFVVELKRPRAHLLLSNAKGLAGLGGLCAMLRYVLPERDIVPDIYSRASLAVDCLQDIELWPLAYLACELALLEQAGIGLELDHCAVTGATEGLTYISPKTGSAVSAAGAGEWATRLLPLEPALLGQASGASDVCAGLRVLDHFWITKFVPHMGRALPAARERLITALA